MFIILNPDWKVGSLDILKDITQHRKEPAYILDHTDYGGSKMVPSTFDIVKAGYEIKHSDVSEETKLYVHYFGKVGHTILESLTPLCWAVKSLPNIKFIINNSEYLKHSQENVSRGLNNQSLNYSETYYELMLKILDFYKIDYEMIQVDFKNKEILELNNFYTFSSGPLRSSMLDSLMQVLDEMYPELKDISPHRKIYLSRQKTWIPLMEVRPADVSELEENGYHFRILKERRLEKFLLDNGYEIVYAEDFKTFEEQLRFMRSVKEMISVTCSGLNNMLFMHPGQTVIELFTVLGLNNPINPEYQLHDHYHALGFYKKLYYFSIPLVSKESDWIIESIKNNKYLKGMFDD